MQFRILVRFGLVTATAMSRRIVACRIAESTTNVLTKLVGSRCARYVVAPPSLYRSGKPKPTLGDIIKKHADIFPPPLDDALSKLWGYASNEARHGKEGRNLELDEVFLFVGVSATLATYLARKVGTAER